MKRKIKLLLLLLCFSGACLGQVEKEIENGIFVTFPLEVKYQVNNNQTSYVCKTDNCMFIVLTQRNVIPNYHLYAKAKKNWSKNEIAKVENSFLDNAVQGKLAYTESKGEFSNYKLDHFNGRYLNYKAINPLTGKKSTRYSKILLVRDRLINFECWFLNENHEALQQKENFYKSIRYKK
ncbi:hypothetical protein ACXGQW_03125 [Wenyingzhuangia sp. IMCC45533]